MYRYWLNGRGSSKPIIKIYSKKVNANPFPMKNKKDDNQALQDSNYKPVADKFNQVEVLAECGQPSLWKLKDKNYGLAIEDKVYLSKHPKEVDSHLDKIELSKNKDFTTDINKSNPLLIKVSSIKKDETKSWDEMQTDKSTTSKTSTISEESKSKNDSKDVEMEVEDNLQIQLNKKDTKSSNINEMHTTKDKDKMDVDKDPSYSNVKPKINEIIEKEEEKSSFKNKMSEQNYPNQDKENRSSTNKVNFHCI